MYISAIIPAAGFSLRLKHKVSKPLVKIKSVPILIYALKAISQHPYIKEVIVVANQFNIKAIEANIKHYRITKVRDILLGGMTRRLSVENALKVIKDKVDYVLVHDAVRPFIPENVISKVIDEAVQYGAAVVGVPVVATIKKVGYLKKSPAVHKNLVVAETLDRDRLWEAQTPQVFRKDIILMAYNRFKDDSVTDDASLVERLGVKVKMVMGSYFNIKITTSGDLILAEAILKAQKSSPQFLS